jgi:hypothetical protein
LASSWLLLASPGLITEVGIADLSHDITNEVESAVAKLNETRDMFQQVINVCNPDDHSEIEALLKKQSTSLARIASKGKSKAQDQP